MVSVPKQLLIQAILIALNAFFAAMEIAVISLNTTKLKRLVEEGDEKAGKLLSMAENPAGFLSTIQVGISLSGFLGAAFAADSLSEPLTLWLLEMGVKLPEALPVPFSAGSEYFYLTAEKQRAAISIPCRNGRVRNFYPNPRDYVYLPDEDTVIPKSLSGGIDRSKRQPAKPQTCYTWFACSESFLSDINLQETYLKKNLKILLSFI